MQRRKADLETELEILEGSDRDVPVWDSRVMDHLNYTDAYGRGAAIYETRRQIEYKAEWNGNTVVQANMWFPSSQLCSQCGEQHKDLHLRDSVFTCPACGFSIDRDVNAARNLEKLAAGAVATARGDSVRPDDVPAVVVEARSQQGVVSAV